MARTDARHAGRPRRRGDRRDRRARRRCRSSATRPARPCASCSRSAASGCGPTRGRSTSPVTSCGSSPARRCWRTRCSACRGSKARGVPGLPSDEHGFIPTDPDGCVRVRPRARCRRRHQLPGQAGRPGRPAGRRCGGDDRPAPRRPRGAASLHRPSCAASCSPAARRSTCERSSMPPASRCEPGSGGCGAASPRARCGGRRARSPAATSRPYMATARPPVPADEPLVDR